MEERFFPKIRSFLNEFKRQSYLNEDKESVNLDVIVDCSLGVNPFGCSSSISDFSNDFLKNSAKAFSFYPAYPYFSLRQAISRYWKEIIDVDVPEIRVGAGSMAILEMLCKCMIDPGSKTLGFVPQFPDFSACVMSFGGIFNMFPLNAANGFELDVKAFCAEIDSEKKIVYIDNPNNPTGQVFPLEAIARIATRCRECGVLLIVDEAYGDYIEKSASAVSLFSEHENLCILRSFSKGFGLASLRVGYAFIHEPLAGCFDRVSYQFNVSAHGAVLAEQALLDEAFMLRSRKAVARIKRELISSLTRLQAAPTHPEVPIFTILAENGVSLFEILRNHGVLSEAGEDYTNLGKHAVRMRVPKESEPLITILREIEQKL